MARGRTFDPRSGRSERRGITLNVIPAEGYRGEIPNWPRGIERGDDGKETVVSKKARSLWRELWRCPQGAAWINQPWRNELIAEYCQVMAVVAVDPGKSAALIAQLHRYRDQLGLTPSGMKENGWKLGVVDTASRASDGGSRDRIMAMMTEREKAAGS